MLTRAQKETEVATLKDYFNRATSVIVADYRGLDVASVDALRSQLRSAGDEGEYAYRVTKNTLIRRAAVGTPLESLAAHFQGPTALAFSFGDPAGLAKLLVDYAKVHEVFELRAGIVEGRPIDSGEIATLATLPSLDALRSKLIGVLLAPATKLVQVVQAPAGQLARLMTARQEKLEAGAGTAS